MVVKDSDHMAYSDDTIQNHNLEETVRLINCAGISLQCTIMTRVKNLLIYHHFRACVGETEYDPHTVAAACISLGTKCNEEQIALEAIVLLFYSMIVQDKDKSTQSKHFKDTLQTVSTVECVILRMLEFDLNHTVAHQFLPYFMNDLKEGLLVCNAWDLFAETCMKLASDFYLSNKCMIYKADEIAISVIKFSLHIIGVNCSYFELRLKAFNNCPQSKILSIIEDIYSFCYIGPSVESGFLQNNRIAAGVC